MLAGPDISDDFADRRWNALNTYHIQDTAADTTFDNLLNLTSKCLAIPIAFVSLIDEQRQYFVGSFGACATDIPRHLSFCEHTLQAGTVFEIIDAEADLHFKDHPLVLAKHIRYYAGAPLIDENGNKLGTICVFDYLPRRLSEVQKEMLLNLAAEVLALLKLKRMTHDLHDCIADLTDKRKAEEELQVLSLVASKTNTGVNIMDNEGITTWVNHSLEKLTGYTLEELKGNQLGNILSANFYDQELLDKSRMMSKNNQSYAIEVPAEKKDGSQIWLEVSNTPVINNTGVVERQIDLISDITLRKQIEQEMIAAREQALKLSQAKEMFLSVMSHEIRTPLNAIIGLTHLLLDNEPKPSQVDDLNILRFSGENLLHIINDILDFNKIETGNMELEEAPFNLKSLANDIVNSLRVNVKKNHNDLKLLLDPAIPDFLYGDKNRLYQILMNFLSNAIKFTNNGFIKLKIHLLTEDDERTAIKFVIEDTGIGIPKDKHDYIFETFTQAKTDISRKYGGSGLGLAITKKLLTLYNAQIKVDSVEGEGTSFSFKIEFQKANETSMMTVPATDLTVFLNKRILVVDDNEINIMIIRRILSKWGLAVDSATDGYEAIERVRTGDYDLIFMDIKMPGIDGFETTSLIRTEKKGNHIPVIALTASTLKNDFYKFEECGMNGHVLKPFNPDEIKVLLFNLFSAYPVSGNK